MDSLTTFKSPIFVYDVYIQAAPETVWNALVDPVLTAQYWDHINELQDTQEWAQGAQWAHVSTTTPGQVDALGYILESIPGEKLKFTFENPQTFPASQPPVADFTLTAMDGLTKLHLTQVDCADEQEYRDISLGWPAVLSSMKTVLETGKPLTPAPWSLMVATE